MKPFSFFGLSNPYDDLTVKSLQFLTLEQSIDDLEYFVKNVKVPVPVMLDGQDSFEGDEVRGAEFTLAMDLPPPPRGWNADESSYR